MGGHVRAGDLDVWVEQVASGPGVLLIGGLGGIAESWRFQLDGLRDRYRLTAFDNRGAGRTALPAGPLTVAAMADDAAAVLDAAGSRRAGAAPSERAFLAGFFLALYTPRAHEDGTVAALIDEVLAFPHKPAPEAASAPWTPSSRTGASTGSGASPSPRWCRPAAST